jgi:sodium-coupled neutral amino acid transporter 11
MSLVCCLLMAVTGFLVFTDKTQGNILNNFAPDDLIINIARFCFGANMSTTSKLHLFPSCVHSADHVV